MAQFDAAMMGVVTFVVAGFLEMLTTGWWVCVVTVDSSLKERTSDIESNHCSSRDYASHCLHMYGANQKKKTRQHSTRDTTRLVQC